jgi:hypothetical protein
MRQFPIIFSFNYVTHETVPEVDVALVKAGFLVCCASSVNRDGSYVNDEELIKRIWNNINVANEAIIDDPEVQIAVLVHFDNYNIFNDARLVKMLGRDPFVVYVHADQESRICAFKNGVMEEWFRATGSITPEAIVGCPICVNGSADRRLHVVPADFRLGCNIPILSVRERWLRVDNGGENRVCYFRSYRTNNGVTVNYLYEIRKEDGVQYCVQYKDSDAGEQLLQCLSSSLAGEQTNMTVYNASEILGTNVFLLSVDGGTCKSGTFFVSLCASEEEMNNFVNSRLYRELTYNKN